MRLCLLMSALVLLSGLAAGQELPPSPLYQEKLRPQFHVTARQWDGQKLNPGRGQDGWLNDLNGLVYYDGEYHLFAQRWATAWLHWVSRDLVHWTELPPAFSSLRKWDAIQSGSAVIDKENTSGLGAGAMVAFWSGGPGEVKEADGTAHSAQHICYSNDKGRTWTRYAKNPVLKDGDRDPKVFWYAPPGTPGKWVMVLFTSKPSAGYAFYSSKDLLNWERTGYQAGFYECPDMFALPLDGDSGRMKWVLVNGDGSYVVGDFDGSSFKGETERTPSCAGPDFYATQTFNNAEDADGRRIQLAWLRRGWYPNEFNYPPDMPFNQQMTFPCELTLRSYHGTMRLFRKPIAEIEKLHTSNRRWEPTTLAAGQKLQLGSGELLHIQAELAMSDGSDAIFRLRGETLRIANGAISLRNRDVRLSTPKDSAGRSAPIALTKLDILLDRTSIEVFANDGELSLAAALVPSGNDLDIECTKGEIRLESLVVHSMGSIWEK